MKLLTYAITPFILSATIIVVALAPLACNHGGAASCQPQTVGCVIVGSLVDCTGVNSLGTAVTQLTPVVTRLINGATNPDGSVNWTSIESKLEQLAWQYGICVIAEIWNTYVNGGAGSGSAVATKLTAHINTSDFKTEFDRIRAHVAPGYAIKLSAGGVL